MWYVHDARSASNVADTLLHDPEHGGRAHRRGPGRTGYGRPFAPSRATDQAYIAVTIECSPPRSEAQAWKLLASIALSHFDVLENSDSESGYLRTACAVKLFYRAEGRVPERLVRTRVIVKRTSESPLRYTVKLVSKLSRTAGGSPEHDELFEPWDRLLNSYADVIAVLQARLK